MTLEAGDQATLDRQKTEKMFNDVKNQLLNTENNNGDVALMLMKLLNDLARKLGIE